MKELKSSLPYVPQKKPRGALREKKALSSALFPHSMSLRVLSMNLGASSEMNLSPFISLRDFPLRHSSSAEKPQSFFSGDPVGRGASASLPLETSPTGRECAG